jgi:hypothetical protein
VHRTPQRPPPFILHSSAPNYRQQILHELRATFPTLIKEAKKFLRKERTTSLHTCAPYMMNSERRYLSVMCCHRTTPQPSTQGDQPQLHTYMVGLRTYGFENSLKSNLTENVKQDGYHLTSREFLSLETVDILCTQNSGLHHVATLYEHLTHSHLPGPELNGTLPGITVL